MFPHGNNPRFENNGRTYHQFSQNSSRFQNHGQVHHHQFNHFGDYGQRVPIPILNSGDAQVPNHEYMPYFLQNSNSQQLGNAVRPPSTHERHEDFSRTFVHRPNPPPQQHQAPYFGQSNNVPNNVKNDEFHEITASLKDGKTLHSNGPKTQKDLDADWISSLVAKRYTSSSEGLHKHDIKISSFKELLQKYSDLLKIMKLKRQSLAEVTNDELWNSLYTDILGIKEEMCVIKMQLEDPAYLDNINRLIRHRRRKRERIKHQRIEAYAVKLQRERTVDDVHKRLDKWQDNILQAHLDKKREAEVKAAADTTLSEVRRKSADVTKSISVLVALKKLRAVRRASAVRKGEVVQKSRDKEFEASLTEQFDMLKKQQDIYQAEQKALEVMLETEQEETKEREREEEQRKKEREKMREEKQVLEWLFGKGCKSEPRPCMIKRHFATVTPRIIENVPVLELLPCLPAVTTKEKEVIKEVHWMHGQASAMEQLFGMLQKRHDWLDQLSAALRYPAINQSHLANQLYPDQSIWQCWDPMHPFQAFYDQADNSLLSLLQIRGDWDRYVVPGDHPGGRTMPPSWVTPVEPSSETWAERLKS